MDPIIPQNYIQCTFDFDALGDLPTDDDVQDNLAPPQKQKCCLKCHKWLPATSEYWYKSKRRKDGWHYYCKVCMHSAAVARNPRLCVRCHISAATRDRFCDECLKWKQENPNLKRCHRCEQWLPVTTEYWYREKASRDGFGRCCKTCTYKDSIAKTSRYVNSRSSQEKKLCSICHQWLPATPEYWSRDRTHKDGFRSDCKTCRSKKYAAHEPYQAALETQQKQKCCAKCSQYFPATLKYWYQDRAGKYGLHNRCKACVHKAYVARDPRCCIRCHIRTTINNRLCDECLKWKQENPDAMYCPRCNRWLSMDHFGEKNKPKKRLCICISCRRPKVRLDRSEEIMQKYSKFLPPTNPKEQDETSIRQNKRQRDRYAERTRAGICGKCFTRPAKSGRRTCDRCYIYGKQLIAQLRNQVFVAYGGKCAICNESNPAFLTVDHIDNDGADHRRIICKGQDIYHWLRKNGFPQNGFQLLCANCNWRKHIEHIIHQSSEKANIRTQTWNATLRKEVLTAYGNKCICCGEDRPEVLTIDHVNNDGAKHRLITGGGNSFYSWLRKNGFPQDGRFQILCFNCNRAKFYHGICPHQQ